MRRRQNRVLRGNALHPANRGRPGCRDPREHDGKIAGLTISDPPTQAQVQALRDKCEDLADDVRTVSTLVQTLRAALVAIGVVKGGA
jgi:hypothetical protein